MIEDEAELQRLVKELSVNASKWCDEGHLFFSYMEANEITFDKVDNDRDLVRFGFLIWLRLMREYVI